MKRAGRGRGDRLLLKNQPYDESLEADGEEVESGASPSPSLNQGNQESARSVSRRRRSLMSANSSSGDSEQGAQVKGHQEEEEESDEDESEEEDEEEEEEPAGGPDGVYDPADYVNLPVTTEIRDLFKYITRYSPQVVELDHSLKPFIPDFIPAVGDIDAFLKVPRPDGKADVLGLELLDEPSVKQSDPTVMSLWLSEESKQHTTQVKVSSVPRPQSNPRLVDSWVQSIAALHRSKPAASVQYGRRMPDVDTLMQEWPAQLEERLQRLRLPPARLRCSLDRYVDVVCALLDVPVYSSRVQSLHLLFSLYLEFRDSAHFVHRAH